MHSSRHVSEITSNDLLLDCLISDLDNTADLLMRQCPNNFDEEAIIVKIVEEAIFLPSKCFLGNLVCSDAAVLILLRKKIRTAIKLLQTGRNVYRYIKFKQIGSNFVIIFFYFFLH